jgi:O-antigen ligase
MIRGRSGPFGVLVGVGALALVAAGWVLSLAMTESPTTVVACVSGILLAATVFISPRVGFYVLIASAMFNRFDVFVGGVHLRPDQIVLMPVLAGIAPRLAMESVDFLSRPNQRLRVPTLSAIVFGGLVLYIAINLLSSYLFSPEFWESFQIVAWFVLSFMAFAAAYLLIGRYVGPREAFFALLASGFVSGAIGVVFFALFKLTGSMVGIQPPDVATEPVYKAAGTFLEANLFGSFQGFTVVATVALLSSGEKMKRSVFLLLILGTTVSTVALAFSLTRAAWLGALCGLLLVALFQLRSGRSLMLLLRLAVVGLASLAVLIPTGLLESVAARFRDIGISESSGSGTLAFRLERFRVALQEWPASPILGLGTNSYGQRHWDPTQDYAPDYLPNLLLATLYDTGIIGSLTLLIVFVVLVGALIWLALRGETAWQRAIALAMLCGAAVLFVSYQTTNGFWFSYVWIILAVALKVCLPWQHSRDVS